MIAGKYEIVISDDVMKEISNCALPKFQMMSDMLEKIDYTLYLVNDYVDDISNEIIRLGILKERNRIDCNHIACAIITKCDYLVSWNFDDLANVKTNNGVKAISLLLNKPSIEIISPYNLKFREEE